MEGDYFGLGNTLTTSFKNTKKSSLLQAK